MTTGSTPDDKTINKPVEFIRKPKINGVYQHYKGGTYRVLTLAHHSETQEDLVVYRSIEYGSTHARPLSMWFELVMNHENEEVQRFQFDH